MASTAKRHAKTIKNQKDIDYILSLSREEAASKSVIMDLFADFGDGPRFHTYDLIEIPPKSYGNTKKNKNTFTTTVGLYIYNKGSIESMADVLGYINTPITKKQYGKINEAISYARLEDKITIDQLKDFIMQTQVYMSCTTALASSHTMRMLLVTKEVEKKKKQLEVKYKDAIENKDIKAISEMENELLAFSKEYLDGDPSMDMYDSGARGSFGNNFKNMYVMKGAVRLSDGSYEVVTSSYISGLQKEDFSKINDSAIAGPYSRAVNTQKGGAIEKEFVLAFQHVKVLPKGSDCGTKRTITVTLTDKNIQEFMYCFVVQGSRLVEITSENKNSFIGKTVKLRFSTMCESKNGICEKCAGTLFTRLGIENIGVATYQMASKQKNVSMKFFHDSTVNLAEMDVEKVFGLK